MVASNAGGGYKRPHFVDGWKHDAHLYGRHSCTFLKEEKLTRLRYLLASALLLLATSGATALASPPAATACAEPAVSSIAAAFDLAAAGQLTAGSEGQGSIAGPLRIVPPSLLKAIGWVESGWRQLTPQGRPLLSPDFGYGIMQVTSGMAGAFSDPTGEIDPASQSAIASDYRFNIAYGASILRQKWRRVPGIGDGDPTVLENWYYAVWAYNGWGWVNNPNNPRFSRVGTPATSPSTYPYQERVLYLVSHPPKDREGNPLWQPVPVKLPPRSTIGRTPESFVPIRVHRQAPPAVAVVYQPSAVGPVAPSAEIGVRVKLINSGTQPWLNTGTAAISLTYHLFTAQGNPWQALSPFSPGILAYGQRPVLIPHTVLPGGSITVVESVQVPTQTGTYRLVWDLQEGDSVWASQQHVLPRVQKVVVTESIATPTPRPIATPVRKQPSEGNQYLRDTAIPDGTVLHKSQHFVKGWLVFNSGRTAWDARWSLHLTSGKAFGAADVPLPPTASCHSANVLVPMVAPRRPGAYRSVWRAQDPNGHRFGQSLTLVVTVQGRRPAGGPTPVPTPTTVPRTPRPTPTPTPSG